MVRKNSELILYLMVLVFMRFGHNKAEQIKLFEYDK